MELGKIIGTNIQNLRKEKNMTQKDLANLFSYTSNAVSKWERGEALPEIATLKAIADYFGVTVDCLLSENGFTQKENYRNKDSIKAMKLVKSLLMVSLVLVAVTVVFVYLYQNQGPSSRSWTVFIWGIPLSCLPPLWIYYRDNYPVLKFVLMTTIVWGLLTAIYLQFIEWNMYLIFLIGIPAQLSVFLWSQIIKIRK